MEFTSPVMNLPGLDRVPWHNPKNDAQEKTSTRSRYDVPDVLRLGARNLLQLSVTSLRLVRRLARAAVQQHSSIIPSIYIHRLLALFALLLVRFRLESKRLDSAVLTSDRIDQAEWSECAAASAATFQGRSSSMRLIG